MVYKHAQHNGEECRESGLVFVRAIVSRVIAQTRETVWWMTRRAPVNYAVDDVASTGALCGESRGAHVDRTIIAHGAAPAGGSQFR